MLESPPPAVIAALRDVRLAARTERTGHSHPGEDRRLPRRAMIAQAIADIGAALYPRRLGGFVGSDAAEDGFVAAALQRALLALTGEIDRELHYWSQETPAAFDDDQPRALCALFAQTLPDIRRLIDSDIEAAFLGDPAARSTDEILACYPGAIATRLARRTAATARMPKHLPHGARPIMPRSAPPDTMTATAPRMRSGD